MDTQSYKGTRDLLPEDMRRFRLIEDVFRSCCRGWGYQEVRTPSLEYLHLFTATGTLTSTMLGRVYSFLDWDGWSGERVVLRPDGTIPLARLFINNLAQQKLARLCYITNVFVFEATGTENREKWQCGAEFLGSNEPVADVEIMLLAAEVLRSLGFSNSKVSLSHAGVVKALLKELKLEPGEEAKALNQILEGNWQVFTDIKIVEPPLRELLPLLVQLPGETSGFVKNLRALCPPTLVNLRASLDNFIEVAVLLDAFNYEYQIDFKSLHGFEYYTGVCFEFLVNSQKIGGGGRYNDLIPLLGGGSIPACGFALYIDPLTALLPLKRGDKTEQGILIEGKTKTIEGIKTCFYLAQALRQAGYIAELDFLGQKTTHWRWLITINEEELPSFVVLDRDKNQTKKAASYNELLNLIGGFV